MAYIVCDDGTRMEIPTDMADVVEYLIETPRVREFARMHDTYCLEVHVSGGRVQAQGREDLGWRPRKRLTKLRISG